MRSRHFSFFTICHLLSAIGHHHGDAEDDHHLTTCVGCNVASSRIIIHHTQYYSRLLLFFGPTHVLLRRVAYLYFLRHFISTHQITMRRSSDEKNQKEFHIAPMLDVSTVEFRYFIRLLTKRSFIWTEMVVAETLVYRNRASDDDGKELSSCEVASLQLSEDLKRYCGWWDKDETDGVDPHPTVCQIGTNDPQQAAFAAAVAQQCGYDRIDLNAECPSDRVSGRCFGAVLMQEQDVAARVVKSMIQTTQIPFSVKTRIGCDDSDSLEESIRFIQKLVDGGCYRFVIHARKVYTKGLSPAQNRTVPPLNYPHAYKLMEHFPQCEFILNGGIRSVEHARKVAYGESSNDCNGVDHEVPCQLCNLPHGSCIAPMHNFSIKGVMVGRLARDHPAALATIDTDFYGEPSNPCYNRRDLMNRYIQFLERVYPRRCCDDDATITLGMVDEMTNAIVHNKEHCDICGSDNDLPVEDIAAAAPKPSAVQPIPRLSGKRSNRHHRNNGNTKIVSRVIDQSLQPTLGILYGVTGNGPFRRELHRLSRNASVRNCGPGFILKKAMQCVPGEVWDEPFSTKNGDKAVQFYPSK